MVYSFGEEGWSVLEFSDFMARNDFRSTIGQEIRMTPEQKKNVEQWLKDDVADKVGDRWSATNNCSTKVRDALEGGTHQPFNATFGGTLDPMHFKSSLEKFGYVAKENRYPKKSR